MFVGMVAWLAGCTDYSPWECEPAVIDRFGRDDDRFGVSADDLVDEVNGWGPVDVRFEPTDVSAALGFDDGLTLEVEPHGRAELVEFPGPGTCVAGGTPALRIGVDLTVRSALGFEGFGRGWLVATSDDLDEGLWVDGAARMPAGDAPASWSSEDLSDGCSEGAPTEVHLNLPPVGSLPAGGPPSLTASSVLHATEVFEGVCFNEVLRAQ